MFPLNRHFFILPYYRLISRRRITGKLASQVSKLAPWCVNSISTFISTNSQTSFLLTTSKPRWRRSYSRSLRTSSQIKREIPPSKNVNSNFVHAHDKKFRCWTAKREGPTLHFSGEYSQKVVFLVDITLVMLGFSSDKF